MSRVVDLSGKEITQGTPSERATDAREALRALLARLDAGEVHAETWLFVYEAMKLERPDMVATRTLDCGLTVIQAMALLDNAKFDLMLDVRGR